MQWSKCIICSVLYIWSGSHASTLLFGIGNSRDSNHIILLAGDVEEAS